MTDYNMKVHDELQAWKRTMIKRSNLINRISKKAQTKVNELIPEKVHKIVTESIKSMVKTTLVGSNIKTNKRQAAGLSLYERDELLKKKLSTFRKTAVIEGAGTGAGGILLGLADFPLLLSIKMKFLFEAAAVYGFDTNDYEERLFILHVFQLAFSSDEKRKDTLYIIENWEQQRKILADMDWREFQQEYRDYIDLVKMLQLIPGIGAVIGAYANYNLLDRLGETAMNAYRLRLLKVTPLDWQLADDASSN
ncbi:EcsC family protein [Domibacillus aminovorans]|uniref:ABC transporter-associated protein EcsC n=1 Tax=Domibacillus aminovorans TaxID=29332 RepID=A0A177L3E0_9BACI|nr:EcsC family protein [Domibacillus aminovorans]OAH60188.1 ABC transporter-associated protein EcsC [Domibacillus aminovorans]